MFGFYDKYFLLFGLRVTYYGLIIAIGMAIGVYLACKNAKLRGFKSDDLVIVACYALPLAIIGARVYYFLFSLDNYTSFWQIFEIWNGGLAIYGGVIGGAIGVGIYCLIHKKNFFDLADVIVPSLILGQVIGRWGNFFNQEAFGYFVDNPNMQWYPFAVFIESCKQAGCICGGSGWHLATFFYESIWNLATFAVLMLLLRKFKYKQRGLIASGYLVLYGSGRVWIEGLRMDSLMLGSIRVSQLLSIILILLGIAIFITYFVLGKKGYNVYYKPLLECNQQSKVSKRKLSKIKFNQEEQKLSLEEQNNLEESTLNISKIETQTQNQIKEKKDSKSKKTKKNIDKNKKD